eukprot:3168537-Karenia_brevis.AAC.1
MPHHEIFHFSSKVLVDRVTRRNLSLCSELSQLRSELTDAAPRSTRCIDELVSAFHQEFDLQTP